MTHVLNRGSFHKGSQGDGAPHHTFRRVVSGIDARQRPTPSLLRANFDVRLPFRLCTSLMWPRHVAHHYINHRLADDTAVDTGYE